MHRNRFHRAAVVSPIEALDAAFVSLSRGVRPLALPAAVLGGRPAGRQVPLDEVRARGRGDR